MKKYLILIALLLASASVLWLNFEVRSAWQERDALRATVAALREGDGSCAVSQKSPVVVCRLEDGRVSVLPLRPGDVIVGRDCLDRSGKLRRARSCAR